MIRILIADDHPIFRAGLSKLLQGMRDVRMVAEASSGRQAVELAGNLCPDIVVMDLAMADLNGLDATAQIHDQHPSVRVIVLSMHANEEYVQQALSAGASGYVLKEAAPDEIRLAIDAVVKGETYLSAAVAKSGMAVDGGAGKAGQAKPLTPRQRQILQLISEGNNVKEIAYQLELSVKTVESHRAELMERLGIRNAAALVRYAARLLPLSGR
jgi:DNA-binding NarL/FixJ family response regulator